MKNLIKFLPILVLCIFFNTTTQAQASFDIDRDVDFTKYKTYSFAGWRENSDQILNNADKKRIIESFKSEFTIRDMDFVLGNADAIVSLYIVVDGGYKKKGTLVVEMVDVAEDKLVWHSVLKKKVKVSSKRGTTIPKSVTKMMKSYPIAPAKK